jgi:hypothetical protein
MSGDIPYHSIRGSVKIPALSDIYMMRSNSSSHYSGMHCKCHLLQHVGFSNSVQQKKSHEQGVQGGITSCGCTTSLFGIPTAIAE